MNVNTNNPLRIINNGFEKLKNENPIFNSKKTIKNIDDTVRTFVVVLLKLNLSPKTKKLVRKSSIKHAVNNR